MAKLNEAQAVHPVQTKIYELIAELEDLAHRRCDGYDTNGVHFLVTEQRRLMTLGRVLKNRQYV